MRVQLTVFKFTKKQRILSRQDYQKVFNQAEFRSGSRRVLLLARRNAFDSGRLGLVIPKKHLRRAVDRNVVKRIAREMFRHRQEAFVGLDVVLLVKGKFDDETLKTQICHELTPLWDQLLNKVRGS